jgi:hypothetical protein
MDGVNSTRALPTLKGVVDRIPWAETLWNISPRNAGVEDPENAIEHLAWFASGVSAQTTIRKLGLDKPPLRTEQLITAGHSIALKFLIR